jgi:superfamily II DNA/RNA helicase
MIATPGRLLDHLRVRRTPRLSQVQMVVLDEADRMLDMGFLPDISRILNLLPKERQSLMFSATFSEEIKKLAANFLRDPHCCSKRSRSATPRRTTCSRSCIKLHESEKTDGAARVAAHARARWRPPEAGAGVRQHQDRLPAAGARNCRRPASMPMPSTATSRRTSG